MLLNTPHMPRVLTGHEEDDEGGGPDGAEGEHGEAAAEEAAHAQPVLGLGLALDLLRTHHELGIVRLHRVRPHLKSREQRERKGSARGSGRREMA